MAPSPRPLGPVRASGLQCFPFSGSGSSACGRRQGRPACLRQRSPPREYGPQGLTRPGPPRRESYSGRRGLHDTAPSCSGSDPGPARTRPRGRAGAQPGPRPSLVPGLSFSPSLSRPRLSDAARPGLPSTAGPTVRAPAAGGRARADTYSAPEAMARASPGRRLWRPEGNGYEKGRRPTRPGLDSLRRRSSSSDKPSGSLPLASSQRHRGGGRAGGRAGDASS